MNPPRPGTLAALRHLLGISLLAHAVPACRPATTGPASPAPAAQVSKAVAEADLATVTLTAAAERRLGIETVLVARRKVPSTRSYSGELLLPLGRATAGHRPAEEQSVYSLLPATTPAELVRAAGLQVDADGQVAAARVQLDAARVSMKRAEDLVAGKAGMGRAVDEARTQVQLAEVALDTARARRALLGAPLFDAVRQAALWVRVPVYAGDVPRIDTAAAIRLDPLAGPAPGAAAVARPIPVPFSTTASPAMLDLFYEVTNRDGALRPGQRVLVELPLRGEEESLVVPPASILHDIHGGTWVYESIAPHTFVRRRVDLRQVVEAGAVLARGPAPGARIVTAGAAELFGTEFGAGK